MLFFYFFYFFNMSMALYNHTACNDYITLHDTASTDVKEKQCGLYRQRFRKLVKMGDSEGVSLQVVGDIRPSEEFKGVKDNIYEKNFRGSSIMKYIANFTKTSGYSTINPAIPNLTLLQCQQSCNNNCKMIFYLDSPIPRCYWDNNLFSSNKIQGKSMHKPSNKLYSGIAFEK